MLNEHQVNLLAALGCPPQRNRRPDGGCRLGGHLYRRSAPDRPVIAADADSRRSLLGQDPVPSGRPVQVPEDASGVVGPPIKNPPPACQRRGASDPERIEQTAAGAGVG